MIDRYLGVGHSLDRDRDKASQSGLPHCCTIEQSDEVMGKSVAQATNQGTACKAFGDLFLKNVHQCREDQLASTGIEPCFPYVRFPPSSWPDRCLHRGWKQTSVAWISKGQLPIRHPVGSCLLPGSDQLAITVTIECRPLRNLWLLATLQCDVDVGLLTQLF